jgi:type III restriction enzyme
MSQSVPTFLREVANSYLFKSPVNVVLASHTPEREFVGRLLKQDNASVIKSWVKSPDVGFYKIEYSYQGAGGGTKRGSFNPDFFLLLESGDVVVVETKADDDNSPVNVAKLKYATDHFNAVNELLKKKRREKRYFFHFVSPLDYNRFFEALRDGKTASFVSTLQAALKT